MHFNPGTIVTLVIASASVAWSVPMSAQATPGSSEQTRQAPQMTIFGCLRGATNPTMEIKGTIYTLEVIEKATAPTGTTGSTPAGREQGAAPKTPSRYTLVASESVGLAKHVDHRVELTGQLKTVSSPSPASRTEPGQAQAQPSAPPPGGAHNTFEVSALKMVSASCP